MSAKFAFTFAEMLAAQEYELGKWEQWLRQQPEPLLDQSVDFAKGETLRDALFHIFVVEQLYGACLHGLLDPNASPKSLFELPHQSWDELFAIHHYGFGLLKDWAAQATAADLKKTFSRGEIRASYRKCFLQVLEHNTRHLAQLAVALRQAGHATDWPHDLIFNPTLE